jgi:ATP-binding cassette, subfamily B, bacterial
MVLPKTLSGFIWYFVKKQRFYFMAITLLAWAWSLDSTVWPYLLKMLIDKMMAFSGAPADVWHYLTPILIIWAATFFSHRAGI